MVPGVFVRLDEMPLTINKKIDRTALPPPDIVKPDLGTDAIAPRDDLERALSSFFAETLRVEQVAADSNFFEIGGNSLLATRIVSRVRETFRVEIKNSRILPCRERRRAGRCGAYRIARRPGGQDCCSADAAERNVNGGKEGVA